MRTMLKNSMIAIMTLLVNQVYAGEQTALDDYVAKEDNTFSFSNYATERNVLYTTYFLNMTSQQWRGLTWTHHLAITVPRGERLSGKHTAILFIDGGNNGDTPPTATDQEIGALSVLSQSVVATLRQVPNQPLFAGLVEDGLLAFTMDRFLASCNEDATLCDWEWPAHLPMTKSAVRAMDAVQQFLLGEFVFVTDFIVTGGSKRGWTTWLTAAVDPRVKAIVPASIDVLKIEPQMDRHWAAYGGEYSPAIVDYTALDIFCRSRGNAKGQKLREIVDPYEYRDRLTMPKLLVNSAGDQFFLPDSSQLYYKDLPGDNRLRYTFNTDHSHTQNNTAIDALIRAVSWVNDINGVEVPNYEWEVIENKLIVHAISPVKEAWLWQVTDAQDPESRDFRLETLEPRGIEWTKRKLSDKGGGTFEAELEEPDVGWTAYSIELKFGESGTLEADHVFTTDVIIKPDILPKSPEDHCAI